MIYALHGMIGDPADWDFLKARLPNVHAPLLWADVDRYTPWAMRFTQQIRSKDQAPALIGYSMGGRLALHALLAAPTLFRAAVIVSAHTGLEDKRQRVLRWRQDDEWAARLRTLPWEVFLRIWNDQAVFQGSHPPGPRLTSFKWRQNIIRALDLWGLSRQENLLPKLERLDVPVLWITGEKDPRYGEVAQAAAAISPRIQHHVIPNAGHRVPWEQSEAFLAAVEAFFTTHGILPAQSNSSHGS